MKVGRGMVAQLLGSSVMPLIIAGVAFARGSLTLETALLCVLLGVGVFQLAYLRTTGQRQTRRLQRVYTSLERRLRHTASSSDLVDASERIALAVRGTSEVTSHIADTLHRTNSRLNVNNELLRQLAERVDQLTAEQVESAGKTNDLVSRTKRQLSTEMERRLRHQFQQLEALQQLHGLMELRSPLPASRGWAASPDLLLTLVGLIKRHQPALVLECGSGLSTVWMALTMQHYGIAGRVVALEHEEKYRAATSRLVIDHGVEAFAEVRLAPLVPQLVEGTERNWYAPDQWTDLSKIDMLVVDGPPGASGPLPRYPALPLLEHRLTAAAVVVLDDCNRDDEKETLARWEARFHRFAVDTLPLEKGCALLVQSAGHAEAQRVEA